jgi:hypothetical protein
LMKGLQVGSRPFATYSADSFMSGCWLLLPPISMRRSLTQNRSGAKIKSLSFWPGGESGLSQDSQQRRLWFRRLARMEDKRAAD